MLPTGDVDIYSVDLKGKENIVLPENTNVKLWPTLSLDLH